MNTKLQNQNFIEEVKKKIYHNNFLNPKVVNLTGVRRSKKFTPEEKTKLVIEGQGNDISIDKLCRREGISPATFNRWTQNFLKVNNSKSEGGFVKKRNLSQDEKFEIVIEGKSGASSIAEICRRENITQDDFLEWNQNFLEFRRQKSLKLKEKKSLYFKNNLLVAKVSNSETFKYLETFIDFSNPKSIVTLDSNSVKLDQIKEIESIICFQKVNDIRFINKYFEKINSKLPKKGVFIGRLETFSARRDRMKINRIPFLNNIYFFFEFLFKRILPKVSFTKKYYFDITKGNDRLISKAEVLGRLVSCGFEIIDYKTIDGLICFIVKKVEKPTYDVNPSYGPVYRMPRTGKNGKTIKVYKFRTMHPYSEYLQEYMVKANGYAKTGKPANDFRIPKWGKVMRKFWLDELPQLINVVKGDMKLVGIRPLSKFRFNEIPKEMQKLRSTQKPGCIPPYIALNRSADVMSLMQSEKDYIEEKIRNPYTTDTKYFFKAIFNIIFKHRRSA